ncbi:MAG: hypothetical protein AAF479_00565 [Pseudomonadota bacterium]
MTLRDRLIYAAVMGAAVFFVGEFVLNAGTFLTNVVFSIAMGGFAFVGVTLAARFSGRGK